MNLAELRERLWWELSDGANIDEMATLTAGYDTRLINEAIYDLADCLHICKDCNLVPEVGKVTLPGDFMQVQKVKYKDNTLEVVFTRPELELDSVQKYFSPSNGIIELYGAPPEGDTTPVTLYYRAYPAELSEDTDVPVDIPREYQDKLVTVYGKAQFVRKYDYVLYQQLMNEWRYIKKILYGLICARSGPTQTERRWEW